MTADLSPLEALLQSVESTAPALFDAAVVPSPDDAVALARAYAARRKVIRQQLIALARAAHPRDNGQANWTDSTHRKLYQYPSDLTDQRLLDLIDNPARPVA